MSHSHIHPLRDLMGIVMPRFCIHCGETLVGDERDICTHCIARIAWLPDATTEGNLVEERLHGLLPFEAAGALLVFHKDAPVQSVVHQIKYHHNTRLAAQYGRLLGEKLADSDRFADIDLLAPVPLHPLKQLQRGYNQSQLLCEAMSRVLRLPVSHRSIYRRRYTNTQTHKSRMQRQDNMRDVFAVRHPERLEGKHILLIDDILTTGATLTACHDALAPIADLRISVAVLAVVAN